MFFAHLCDALFSVFQPKGETDETSDGEKTNRQSRLHGVNLNMMRVTLWPDDVHVAGRRVPFSRKPLDNETQTSDVNKSKGCCAARRGRQCRSDARSIGFVFCHGFVSPYLVCQSRKFHLVQKCKCCKAQGHPPKREQWPQAGGGADSAFEPNQEALMCNL